MKRNLNAELKFGPPLGPPEGGYIQKRKVPKVAGPSRISSHAVPGALEEKEANFSSRSVRNRNTIQRSNPFRFTPFQFSVEDQHVRFDINFDATSRAGLKISSKLLALAQIVKNE